VLNGSACSCSCPMWKPRFCAMTTNVSQITLWVIVRSLPWVQRKRWIHRANGCVHTHWGKLTIEGCDLILATSKALWRALGNIIKRLGRLVEV
jgi:hypothetical protein